MATELGVIPEAVKALSAPITKLVEVLAAGCGRLYGPTDIRRTARAQGDALLIMEEAKARAAELSMRAARRLLDIEERRQENLEAIVELAKLQLPDEVSELPVDPDWTARFLTQCQDVSNADMRAVWAKLLAGEVSHPGSFSLRTLDIVRNLTASEASQFERVCRQSLHVEGVPYACIGMPWRQYSSEARFAEDLTAAELQALQEAGLLLVVDRPVLIANTTRPLLIEGSDSGILVEGVVASDKNWRPDSTRIAAGNVAFTRAGQELAPICDWNVTREKLSHVCESIREQGFVANTCTPKGSAVS